MGRKGLQINEGQRYGLLTVESFVGSNSHGDRVYKCKCDCGSTTSATASDLVNGNKKSCGCLHGENHGHSDDRLYSVWCTMKARCNNPNNQKYKDYGGRGISVCDEWMHSFKAFYEWAMSNGYDYDAPIGQCTIERIDVNGNYEPSNCCWADAKTQANNQRPREYKVHGIEFDYGGKHYISVSELARDCGVHPARLERRIHRMSVEDALNEIRASIITEDGLLKSIRFVPEDKWNQVLHFAKQGMSHREIGRKTGMTKLAVRRIVARHKDGLGPYNNQLPRIISSGGYERL